MALRAVVSKNLLIVVLAASLLLLSGWVVFDKLDQAKKAELQQTYRQGLNDGVAYAVDQVMRQASTCSEVTLSNSNNQSMKIVAVPCISREAGNSSGVKS